MMKTLVVYYSRTGHNAEMAKHLHADISGDIDEIVDMKNREKMFGCVVAAMLRAKTQIQYTKDPAKYGQVVVVSPLWGGMLPPATRTYLAQNRAKLAHYAFLSVCGKGEENTRALQDVTAMASKRPLANFLVKETEVDSNEAKIMYDAFVAQLPH
jgi:hypothetical protein